MHDAGQAGNAVIGIETVPVEALHRTLGVSEPLQFPPRWRDHPLDDWSMEPDGVVMRYIFRNVRPLRHLEFGTWMGDGVLRCVEECDATVWTLNLLEGESKPDGTWAYGALHTDNDGPPVPWSERLMTDGGLWVRTDAYGSIGHKYRAAGWGKRVCQIYCDSREWDTRAYPDAFFDTAFIDGGHGKDIIESDSARVRRLVRRGGLVIWHDFCPDTEVNVNCASTAGMNAFVAEQREQLARDFRKLFWIDPSWLLVGIRA
jgi:hypothetical protein